MANDEEVRASGNSSRGNAVVARTLYPVPTRHLTVVPTVSEDTSWIESIPAGCDALISVWWDQPPVAEAR